MHSIVERDYINIDDVIAREDARADGFAPLPLDPLPPEPRDKGRHAWRQWAKARWTKDERAAYIRTKARQ